MEPTLWHRATNFASKIYAATVRFSNHEHDTLAAAMRISALQAASKIAEADTRFAKHERLNLLMTARGLLCELETQTAIATHLALVDAGLQNEVTTLAHQLTLRIRSIRECRNFERRLFHSVPLRRPNPDPSSPEMEHPGDASDRGMSASLQACRT